MKQSNIKNGHGGLALKETLFENDRLSKLGVEVLSFSYLCGRTSARALRRPERVHFYMIMFVTAGRGLHTVDSVTSRISRGCFVVVRPGQVQQWHPEYRYRAEIVLIDPIAMRVGGPWCDHAPDLQRCPASIRVPHRELTRTAHELDALKSEIRRFDHTDGGAALIGHLLLALLHRVVRWSRPRPARSPGGERAARQCRAFQYAVNADFRRKHRVANYALTLGYAVSTLNRACVAMEGRSAKSVLDRRIALEAQRLLVHSHASLVEISHYLGFSEPGNFPRFFARVAGTSPLAFRSNGTATATPTVA